MQSRFVQLAGLVAYHIGGYIALPIFLGGSRRTRVAIIDTAKKKILLSKTVISHQQWTLVGGGVKRSEDVVQGALREVKEETGIQLVADQLKFHKEQTQVEKHAKYQAIYYSVKVKDVSIDQSSFEILDLEWFDPRKLPADTMSYTVDFVSELLQN